jgi:very-short-patch-repair endonuclease
MTTKHRRTLDPLGAIEARGGLAATHELAADGITRAHLAGLVRTRRVIRVRQGWYARPGLHPWLVRAARVGGLLTCRSALDLAGTWVVDDGRLHVVVERNDCQLRSPDNPHRRLRSTDAVTAHWHPRRPAQLASRGLSRLLVDPLTALADLAGCTSPELLAATADSLLHQWPERVAELHQLASALPLPARTALLRADGVCESGIETLFWLRMRHLTPRRQVPIPGVGRIDFLFGERLVVEVDGAAFHAGTDEFEADRERDAILSARGYRVLRFSYIQVMERWPEVHAAVWAAILRGDSV